jgi:hypothetical protein
MLARTFKNPGHTPGRLKQELLVIVDEKARAFVKRLKLNKSADPCYLVLFLLKSTC